MLKQMTLFQKFEKMLTLQQKIPALVCALLFLAHSAFAAAATIAAGGSSHAKAAGRGIHLFSYNEFAHLNHAQRVLYIQGMRYALRDAAATDESSSESKPKEASARLQEIFNSNLSLFPKAYAADSGTPSKPCFEAGWMGKNVGGICTQLPSAATQTPNYITCNPLLYGTGHQAPNPGGAGSDNRTSVERSCRKNATPVNLVADDIIKKKQSALWNSTWKAVQDKCSGAGVKGCSAIRSRVLQISQLVQSPANLDPSIKRNSDAAAAGAPVSRSVTPPSTSAKPAGVTPSVPPTVPTGSKNKKTKRSDGDPVDTTGNEWSTAPTDGVDGPATAAAGGSGGAQSSTAGSDAPRSGSRKSRSSRRRSDGDDSSGAVSDSAADPSSGQSSRQSSSQSPGQFSGQFSGQATARASAGGPPGYSYDDSFAAQPSEGRAGEVEGETDGRKAANDELGGCGFRSQCQPNLLLNDLSIPCDTDRSGQQIHPEICDNTGSLESNAVLTPQDAFAMYCTDTPKIDDALISSRRQAMVQTLANITYLPQNDASYYKPLIQGYEKNFELCVAEAKNRKDSGRHLPTNLLPAEYQTKVPVVVRGTMIDVGKGSNVETTNIAYIGQAVAMQNAKLCDLVITGNASGYAPIPDGGGLNQADAPLAPRKRKHKSSGAQ